jgi:DNA adenine methylase
MLKAQGCHVTSNDLMSMAKLIADALVVNSVATLTAAEIDKIAAMPGWSGGMIWQLYGDLYYAEDDISFLDAARLGIKSLPGPKRPLALAALVRACIKRRPRGIFTYIGHRYDDGRKDLRVDLRTHFRNAAEQINAAVFDNGTQNQTCSVDLSQALPDVNPDVVYLDPPYFSPFSDNEYVRRYHFTEALARDWNGVEIQDETKTKKIKNYPNPFRSEVSCVGTISRVLDFYKGIPVVLSYSSNSLPDATTLLKIMRQHGRRASVIEVDHRYSFANQGASKAPVRNKVRELIFTAE